MRPVTPFMMMPILRVFIGCVGFGEVVMVTEVS
jgi:hypothetical protein